MADPVMDGNIRVTVAKKQTALAEVLNHLLARHGKRLFAITKLDP